MSSREYHKAWRDRNREKTRLSNRRYRASHLESERSRNLEYYYKIKRANPVLAWARCSLKNARGRAVLRAVPFSITIDDIIELLLDRCPVPLCGHCELDFRSTKVVRDSPTLDRIDPKLGYVRGNLWVVCFDCNRRMGENTAEELEALAVAKRMAREAVADVEGSDRA